MIAEKTDWCDLTTPIHLGKLDRRALPSFPSTPCTISSLSSASPFRPSLYIQPPIMNSTDCLIGIVLKAAIEVDRTNIVGSAIGITHTGRRAGSQNLTRIPYQSPAPHHHRPRFPPFAPPYTSSHLLRKVRGKQNPGSTGRRLTSMIARIHWRKYRDHGTQGGGWDRRALPSFPLNPLHHFVLVPGLLLSIIHIHPAVYCEQHGGSKTRDRYAGG